MKDLYAKMTFRLVFISFLALILIGCGESGTPGGASGPGVTAAISLSVSSAWETKIETGGEQLEQICTPTADGGERCVQQFTPVYDTVASLPADGKSSATLTINLKDSDGNPVMQGTRVNLHTSMGTFLNGKKDYTISLSESVSDVTTSIISGTQPGKVEITAKSNNISQSTIITFTESSNTQAAFLTLGTSVNTIKTDNSDTATITAVVLDKDRAPIEGVSVSFTTIGEDGSGGAAQISASSKMTDLNGQAEVIFSAGVEDKRNQVVTIEASVEGVPSKQIPIQVTGSYLTVSTEGETVLGLNGDPSVLKVVVRDAGDNPIFNVPVQLSLSSDSTGTVHFDPSSGKTDINGGFQTELTGTGVGSVTVNIASIGATATQSYTVDNPNKLFRIIEPTEKLISLKSGTNQTVKVIAGGYDEVTFAATVGFWAENGKKIITKTVSNGEASAVFNSIDSGTATIQVYPTEDPSVIDSAKFVISAPSSEASKIFFQASSTVIAPSTEDVKNSVTLIAKVTNSRNQVVKDAPVLFSIETPSGGGEYVFPAIALTDESGIATSVFTSGTLVAGADGVKVKAELIDGTASDTVSIIISGKAASLTIGRSTEIESINDDTAYRMPMSILVTDANGSPVVQSEVSLNLWPSHYRTGYWETRKTVTTSGLIITYCVPIVEEERVNEDVNKNLIIEEGEDINKDGLLTPPSSAAGGVPATVVTDENGLANFDLIYMKSSAEWIRDALTASTVVSGTETLSTFSFILPYTIADSDDCALPDSPYYVLEDEPVAGSVTVSSGFQEIIADGNSTTVIRATVLDTNGVPLAGQDVEFSTTLGSFTTNSTVTSDETGVARITLKSTTTPGTATVTANADGFTAQVEVAMTASAADSVDLQAIPSPVVPGGQAIVIATLKDRFGNPVADKQLNFQIEINRTGGSLDSFSEDSDVNGQAILTYTAGDNTGTDKLKVTLDSNQSIFDTFDVVVSQPNFAVGSISLQAGTTSIPADGSSSTAITATIRTTSGAPVPENTTCVFTTNLGTFATGDQVVSNSTSDNSGIIITSLTAGEDAGTAIVTARCGGVSQTITIEFTGSGGGQTVGDIDVRIVDTVLDADGVSQTTVIATVKTDTNQAIAGAEVTFETTGGSITSPGTTDENGQATAVITSDRWNREGANRVEVTARSQGLSDTATMAFSGVKITLSANPDSLLATETAMITAKFEDAAGIPIADEEVAFTTDRGTIPATVTTNSSGLAVALLTSSQAGTATVTANSRYATGTVQVTFGSYMLRFINPNPLDAYFPALNPEPIYLSGVTTKDLMVALYDFGAAVPLAGETVHFSTTLGTLTSNAVVTSAGAVPAYIPPYADAGTTLQAGAQTGKAVVDAEVTLSDGTTLRAQTSVLILANNATKIVLTPSPAVISVDNGESTIRAVVYDANDNPVPFQNVYFRINDAPGGGEYLSSGVSQTNISGIAEVTFIAGAIPSINIDDIEIEAAIDPAFPAPAIGLCHLTIAGPVANISVSVNLNALIEPAVEQGHLEVGVSAIATDINGNPVADNTQVVFGVSSIAFDEDRDDDGRIDCWNAGMTEYAFGSACIPGYVTAPAWVVAANLGTTWFSDDVNQDGIFYNSFSGLGMSASEDALSNGGNQNGIQDPGEDKNGNGVPDPVQGCTIQRTQTTTGGVATAVLNYPMSYADNIKVRLTAESGGATNFYDYILLCTEDMVNKWGTCGLGY